MIVESESSMPYSSTVLMKCRTTKDIERIYNIKVHLPEMEIPVDYMFMVSGEWEDVAKFEKDKTTLIK